MTSWRRCDGWLAYIVSMALAVVSVFLRCASPSYPATESVHHVSIQQAGFLKPSTDMDSKHFIVVLVVDGVLAANSSGSTPRGVDRWRDGAASNANMNADVGERCRRGACTQLPVVHNLGRTP